MAIRRRKTAKGAIKYDVRWIGSDGRKQSRTFDRRADALLWETARRREQQLGDLAPAPPRTDTLADVLDLWWHAQVGEKAPATIRQRQGVLKRCLRPPIIPLQPVFALNRQTLVDWQNQLRYDGVSAIERNRARSALSAMLSFAVDQGIIPANPAIGMRNAREPKPQRHALSALAVEQIRAEFDTDDHASRALVSVMAYGGLRVGEALALDQASIKPKHLRITHSIAGPTKTRSGERVIPLLAPLADDLTAALPNLFSEIAPAYTQWLRNVFHVARERAGIPHVIPASLRHTYATLRLYSGECTPMELHREMGHASWTTTLKHYTHIIEGAALEDRQPLLESIVQARAFVNAENPPASAAEAAKPSPFLNF